MMNMHIDNAKRWHAELKDRITSPALLRVVERHSPEPYPYNGDLAVCEYCRSQCHSHEGINCDDPDRRWPCLDIADIAATVDEVGQ